MQKKNKGIGNKAFENAKEILIYGAGVYGKRVYYSLKENDKYVKAFIVSEIDNNTSLYVDGVPIYEIENVPRDLLNDAFLIVAVSEKYIKEIREIITKSEMNISDSNIYYLDDTEVCKLYRESFPVTPNDFLKKIAPVSEEWGFDRGTPVDRYFIEKFLQRESKKLRQTELTLEVGDDEYSRLFFSDSHHEILNYAEGMDLTREGTIPDGRYDVFICTQTFHQIYEIKKAIQGSYNLLKNGGVMLATVCGTIVKQARNDEYSHFWGFTPLAIERLMKEVYGENVIVEPFGNAMVATAFIQGLAVEELDMDLVNQVDDDYTICISIVAKKVCE